MLPVRRSVLPGTLNSLVSGASYLFSVSHPKLSPSAEPVEVLAENGGQVIQWDLTSLEVVTSMLPIIT